MMSGEQDKAEDMHEGKRKFDKMATSDGSHDPLGKEKKAKHNPAMDSHVESKDGDNSGNDEGDDDESDGDSDGWHRKCHDCGASDKSRYVRVQDCCACCLDKCDDCAIQWWTCKNCHKTICRACGNKCDCGNPQEDDFVRDWSSFVAKDCKERGGEGLVQLLQMLRGNN